MIWTHIWSGRTTAAAVRSDDGGGGPLASADGGIGNSHSLSLGLGHGCIGASHTSQCAVLPEIAKSCKTKRVSKKSPVELKREKKRIKAARKAVRKEVGDESDDSSANQAANLVRKKFEYNPRPLLHFNERQCTTRT